MESNFYCQNLIGDPNFSIDEWNKKFTLYIEQGIPLPDEIGVCCKTQCFNCMSVVGERQLKTKQLLLNHGNY